MDFKDLLDYQTKDTEVIKLERALSGSENRKIYTKMYAIVKEAQSKSAMLESSASSLLDEIAELKKTYQENTKSAGIISNRNLETSSLEDLSTIQEIIKKITNNLNILEKRISQLAEKLNAILVEFNQTKEKNKQAIEEYKKRKAMYEEESSQTLPKIEALQKELDSMAKKLPANWITKYKKCRQDNIFPVFVPFQNKSCGGCRMELPALSLEKIKKDGYLECEHCGRIIYNI